MSQDDVEVTRWRARVAGQAKTLGGKGPVTCLNGFERFPAPFLMVYPNMRDAPNHWFPLRFKTSQGLRQS